MRRGDDRAGTSFALRVDMARTPVLLFAGFLLAPLSAQASFTTFGNPCTFYAPPLAAANLPRLGQVFRLLATSGGSNGPAYEGGIAAAVVAGLSRTSWLGIPLPWTPATIQTLGGFACGDLSIAAEATIVLPFSIPRTTVPVDLPVPNLPSLVGTSVFFQAVDYGMNRHGVLAMYLGVAGEARIGT